MASTAGIVARNFRLKIDNRTVLLEISTVVENDNKAIIESIFTHDDYLDLLNIYKKRRNHKVTVGNDRIKVFDYAAKMSKIEVISHMDEVVKTRLTFERVGHKL